MKKHIVKKQQWNENGMLGNIYLTQKNPVL